MIECRLGGHILHSLFWPNLSPRNAMPTGVLADQIIADFGSTSRLHEMLAAVSMGVQGSGWGVLVYDTISGTIRTAALRDHQYELVAGTEVLELVDV